MKYETNDELLAIGTKSFVDEADLDWSRSLSQLIALSLNSTLLSGLSTVAPER